jgi:glycerol-3-phosphate acyltransferase PlsY
MLPYLETAALAYLVGSIPFSFLVARLFGISDVRRVGSGNVGATNVLRSAGRGAGVIAFVLDAGKGAAASALASLVAPDERLLPPLAAVLAVVGHMYPVWLRFRGGKGVATGLGAFAPLSPWAAAFSVLVFAAVAATTRYVSLGSVAGALTLAALCARTGSGPLVLAATLTAALIVLRHRTNLQRIASGTERRAGQPKE